ncbi:hypothetical protein BB398_03800 [Helicobacter pylori]|nr:hypothetical protein BB398_03800 [Helicobacter pylori]
MEKVLAFFSPSFFIPSFFLGGGYYKPTLNLLKSPKSLAFLNLSFLELSHEKRSKEKTKIQQHYRCHYHGFNWRRKCTSC